MQELIDEYVETRLAYDDAHAISVEADKKHKTARRRLVEGMEKVSNTIDPPEIALKFTLSTKFSIACNQDNKEDVKEWLHEHYGDIEEFTEQALVKKTVEERLKADIEGEELDEFDVPDFFDLKTRPDVSCTGWKKYSTARRSE